MAADRRSGSSGVMKRTRLYWLMFGLTIILISSIWVQRTYAQDGAPVCPPGFYWDRLSGVGCVQEDCFAVGYLNYDGHCVCLEGYQGCYEPINYDIGFDPNLCYPFCPYSKLISCIQAPAVCPSFAAPLSADESSPWNFLPPFLDSEIAQNLSRVFTGPNAHAPTPREALTGATVATALLGSWVALDWLRDQEFWQDMWDGIQDDLRAQFNKLVAGTKLEVGKKVAEQEAPKLSDRLDALAEKYGSAASKDMMGLDKADKKKDQKKDEKKVADPDGFDEDVDKLADEFLKVTDPPKIENVPQAKARRTVWGTLVNAKSKIFDGDEAMIILKELGKLDQNTPRDAKIPMTREGLDGKIGTPDGGGAKEIVLPSGRKIIVTKIEAIGFEGGGKDVPDGHGPSEIDFGKGVVITAQVAELPEKPQAPAPKPAPSGGKSAPAPSQGSAPPSGGPSGQPSGPPSAGGQAPSGGPGGSPPAGDQAPGPGPSGQTPQPPPPPADSDQGEVIEVPPPEGTGGKSPEEYEKWLNETLVTYVDPETGESWKMRRSTRDLLEEAWDLLYGDGWDPNQPTPPDHPTPPDQGMIISDEIDSPDENF